MNIISQWSSLGCVTSDTKTLLPATFWQVRLNLDSYGHQVGDITLQLFSKIIFDSIRETDVFGRIGGEEFALVLPETSKEAAREFAERIRSIFENEKFPEVEKVTISLGVTQFYTDDTSDSIFSRADIALYAAKESGRNKIVVA